LRAKEQGTEEQRNRNRRDRKKEHSNLFACKKRNRNRNRNSKRNSKRNSTRNSMQKTKKTPDMPLVVLWWLKPPVSYPDTQIHRSYI
jgi:hypothetical protein